MHRTQAPALLTLLLLPFLRKAPPASGALVPLPFLYAAHPRAHVAPTSLQLRLALSSWEGRACQRSFAFWRSGNALKRWAAP